MQNAHQLKIANTLVLSRKGEGSNSKLVNHSVAYFMCTLAVTLMLTSFIEQCKKGELIITLMMTMMLLFGVLAVGNSRTVLVWAIILVVPAIITKWANHFGPDLIFPRAYLGFSIFFIMFVMANLFYFIFRSPHVDSEVLCAGIAVYLLIGLLFSLAYQWIDCSKPGSFIFLHPAADDGMKGYISIYFSFITLNTVGYGDILPVSGAARSLAMAEGGIGTIYIATLIARLVSLYSSKNNMEKNDMSI